MRDSQQWERGVSLTLTWDPFLPTGLPHPALIWLFVSNLICIFHKICDHHVQSLQSLLFLFFFLRERKKELIWGREEAEGKDLEEWREGKPWLSCNSWENKSFLKTNKVLCWCCSFGRGRSHRLLLCTVHKEQVDQWAAHRCNVYKFQIEAHGNRGAYWLHWH